MTNLKDLLKQQEALSKQIQEARAREIADAVSRVRATIDEFGLTVQDVFPTGRRAAGKTRSGSKVPPKYRDPATGQTWTGRGKAPKWIDGKDRNQFLIA